MIPRPFSCSDGYCGQEDCIKCHPENFDKHYLDIDKYITDDYPIEEDYYEDR